MRYLGYAAASLGAFAAGHITGYMIRRDLDDAEPEECQGARRRSGVPEHVEAPSIQPLGIPFAPAGYADTGRENALAWAESIAAAGDALIHAGFEDQAPLLYECSGSLIERAERLPH